MKIIHNKIGISFTVTKYKIRKIRLEKGLTLKQLSILSGVSVAHLSDIENNLKHPTLPILLDICGTLKIDINESFIRINYNYDD